MKSTDPSLCSLTVLNCDDRVGAAFNRHDVRHHVLHGTINRVNFIPLPLELTGGVSPIECVFCLPSLDVGQDFPSCVVGQTPQTLHLKVFLIVTGVPRCNISSLSLHSSIIPFRLVLRNEVAAVRLGAMVSTMPADADQVWGFLLALLDTSHICWL